jgi:GTPase SAR1 family protein
MVMNRKILIFGDKGCGKRSLVSAFKYGRFIPDQHELLYDTYVTDIPINGKMVNKLKIRFFKYIVNLFRYQSI